MNRKKKTVLSIVLAVLLVIAAIGNLFLIMNNRDVVWNVIAVTELLALVSGILYVYVICKKEEDTRFFTVSVVLQALVYFLLISMVPNAWYGTMMMLVKFGCLCLLPFAADLGKKKSLAIAIVYVAANVLSLFKVIDLNTMTFASIASLISRVENLILAVSTMLMVEVRFIGRAGEEKEA